jgi:hypothetical protein
MASDDDNWGEILEPSRRKFVSTLAAGGAGSMAGCSGGGNSGGGQQDPDTPEETPTDTPTPSPTPQPGRQLTEAPVTEQGTLPPSYVEDHRQIMQELLDHFGTMKMYLRSWNGLNGQRVKGHLGVDVNVEGGPEVVADLEVNPLGQDNDGSLPYDFKLYSGPEGEFIMVDHEDGRTSFYHPSETIPELDLTFPEHEREKLGDIETILNLGANLESQRSR